MQLLGLDVVMVAHDKEDKRGEDTVLRADIQGGSYAEIFKLADAVGYLHMIDSNKRVLEFNPSDFHTGKNPAGLQPIDVPDLNQDPDFFGNLIDQIKDGIGKIGRESSAVKEETNTWRRRINSTTTAEGMNKLTEEAHSITRKAVKLPVWKLMQTRGETIGLHYDKDTKTWVQNDKPADDQHLGNSPDAEENAA